MGWVVLACKSDEKETKAARAAASPYSLYTDRRCFCSCYCVGIRSVHTGLLCALLLQDIWCRGVIVFYKFGSLSFVLPRINWTLFVVHGKFNYEYILGRGYKMNNWILWNSLAISEIRYNWIYVKNSDYFNYNSYH